MPSRRSLDLRSVAHNLSMLPFPLILILLVVLRIIARFVGGFVVGGAAMSRVRPGRSMGRSELALFEEARGSRGSVFCPGRGLGRSGTPRFFGGRSGFWPSRSVPREVALPWRSGKTFGPLLAEVRVLGRMDRPCRAAPLARDEELSRSIIPQRMLSVASHLTLCEGPTLCSFFISHRLPAVARRIAGPLGRIGPYC
jgi:hypothetical protein